MELVRERGGSSAFIPQTTRVCDGRDNIRSTETPRSICSVDICARGSVCCGESPRSITHSQTRRPHTRFIAHLTSSQERSRETSSFQSEGDAVLRKYGVLLHGVRVYGESKPELYRPTSLPQASSGSLPVSCHAQCRGICKIPQDVMLRLDKKSC